MSAAQVAETEARIDAYSPHCGKQNSVPLVKKNLELPMIASTPLNSKNSS
jgi:hypothetical protein